MLFDAGALIKLRNNISFHLTFLCSWQINLLKHQPIINDALAPCIMVIYILQLVYKFNQPFPSSI